MCRCDLRRRYEKIALIELTDTSNTSHIDFLGVGTFKFYCQQIPVIQYIAINDSRLDFWTETKDREKFTLWW